MPERELTFEACLNIRDMGGYQTADGRTVRWGRLFRGMTPQFMTEADLQRAREEMQLSGVVDLRGPAESSGPIATDPVRQLNIDFMRGMREERLPRPENEHDHAEFFRWWMKTAGPEVVEAVEAIAELDGPALFHCRTGKDRTGLVAATLLGLLGVDDETIMDDYMMSTPYFDDMIAFLRAREPAPSGSTFWPAQEPPTEAGLRAVLDMIREEYGDARGFLKAHGARDEVLDDFIERTLED